MRNSSGFNNGNGFANLAAAFSQHPLKTIMYPGKSVQDYKKQQDLIAQGQAIGQKTDADIAVQMQAKSDADRAAAQAAQAAASAAAAASLAKEPGFSQSNNAPVAAPGLSTGVIVGMIGGGVLLLGLIVVIAVKN